MFRRKSARLAGSGLLALASTFAVQAQPAAGSAELSSTAAAASADIPFDEIVVTARRRQEAIQDVPQATQAVSGAELEALNLFNFEDLSKVVSGVSLSREGGVTTMRGVSFNPTAQTNPAVSFYLNEGPVQPTFLFQTMFDVGQIEVLRGPQGTLRGQSAPTGAITLTTRRPDLYSFGGMAMVTVAEHDAQTFQGALNVPVVEGKFALRFAGISDHNDNGGIRSVNSTSKPFSETEAFRVSARFEPISDLQAVLMFQRLEGETLGFGGAVFGNGSTGAGKATPGLNTAARQTGYALPSTTPPGYNGPVIPIGSRLTVREYADHSRFKQEFASAQVDYSVLGQQLTYVGSWSENTTNPGTSFGDTGNMLLGDFPGRNLESDLTRWTHELRLSSEETIGGFFDYVVGVFYLDEEKHNLANNGLSFQPGAFGSPLGAPIPQSPDLRYSTISLADIRGDLEETSFFANVTFHLGKKTELSGGIRIIDAKNRARRDNTATAGLRAQANLTAEACAAAGGSFEATYAGICDVPVAARPSPPIIDEWDKSPTVYSATLAHRFTDALMVYLNHGTSWRPGPTQGHIVNGTNDPVLASLVQLDDERTKSYELGFKSSWLDKRLIFNVAYYHQKYENLVYSDLTGIPYVSDNGQGVRQLGFAIPMNSNIDAKIDGVDVDASFMVTERWRVSGGVSWADGKYKNQLIPCKDGNFDGIPDAGAFSPAQFPAGVLIARCSMSGRSSTTAKWNATLQSEYSHPIVGDLSAFVSGLLTYTPKNPYADPLYEVPDYALLNLQLGLRNPSAGWEVQVFARNVTNKNTITAKGSTDLIQGSTVANLFGNSGYQSISYLSPRQIGMTFRYSFGSR